MSHEDLVSYAQNGEDIVLWRALGGVHGGVYVDVGGWDPDLDSVTRLFYEHGWRGVTVEPVPDFAEKFRSRRPRDEVVQAAIGEDSSSVVVLHRFGTSGLSTVHDEFAARHELAGLDHEDISVPSLRLDDVLEASPLVGDTIHFLKIDVEGAEAEVVRSIDLRRWRPWVLVVEATEPNSTTATHAAWEPILLEAGYTFTLFDGLSRFYVSPEHPELARDLGYPACALDSFRSAREQDLGEAVSRLEAAAAAQASELASAREVALRWRNRAVDHWANAIARAQSSEDAATRARDETDRLRLRLNRTRQNLAEIRTERQQLRVRVKRMTTRIERLTARLEQSERPEPPTSIRGRVRAAARRVTAS